MIKKKNEIFLMFQYTLVNFCIQVNLAMAT